MTTLDHIQPFFACPIDYALSFSFTCSLRTKILCSLVWKCAEASLQHLYESIFLTWLDSTCLVRLVSSRRVASCLALPCLALCLAGKARMMRLRMRMMMMMLNSVCHRRLIMRSRACVILNCVVKLYSPFFACFLFYFFHFFKLFFFLKMFVFVFFFFFFFFASKWKALLI